MGSQLGKWNSRVERWGPQGGKMGYLGGEMGSPGGEGRHRDPDRRREPGEDHPHGAPKSSSRRLTLKWPQKQGWGSPFPRDIT